MACVHCTKRNEVCHFSNIKRSARSHPSKTRPVDPPPDDNPHSLFIDRIIHDPAERALLYDEFSVLGAHDQRVPSSGIAFFSNARIDSLIGKLGNTRLKDLVHQVDGAIRLGLLGRSDTEFSRTSLDDAQHPEQVPENEARLYIDCYFETVHPVFPFLDRTQFEAKAYDLRLPQTLGTDAGFCALYYAVLALGCQNQGSSSFDPGTGKAWKLFRISLVRVRHILMARECLQNLQAVIAMAIFCTAVSCVQVDHVLLAEASRMVIALRYHKSSALDADPAVCHRAFWVVYHMEKQYKFQARNSSSIDDCDVGCPIPNVPEAIFGEYNWFLSSIRISRIYSVANSALFSVTASTCSAASLLPTLNHIQDLLEEWRQSIPLSFRPREALEKYCVMHPASKEVTLRTHLYYFHILIALERFKLHLCGETEKTSDNVPTLLDAARGVIELVRFIDVEPSTPIFILAIMPLSALFIIFDFVVHHPHSPRSRQNLMLLDIVSGHFSLLEHASNGSLPAGYLRYFSHIAQQYIYSKDRRLVAPNNATGETPMDIPSQRGTETEMNQGAATSVNHDTPEQSSSIGGFDSQCTSSDGDPWLYNMHTGTDADLGALFNPILSWEDLSQ
ncbi:hypothetical protein FE257_007139 [Aspergillus nanangensis]|uniref:Xylanolytic transcriptional activator regulatory domain-containing protein n=1 Tax=Aspergillus nanangensis TaxID=2582783 RepID=A0AAD4GUE8_ASPNN|nr:hypothetical protein FE257_007139 [Aspergillus nanangensis]